MNQKTKSSLKFITLLLIFTITLSLNIFAQGDGIRPHWWFGAGLGLNYNIYSSDIKELNGLQASPSAFTKGSGAGLYVGGLIEYRPTVMWGGFLNLGFDGRGGDFKEINSGGVHKLSTSLNFISIEPNLRFNPIGEGLYLFLGPKLGFNVSKSFEYQTPTENVKGDFNSVRGTLFGGQIGVGYDIPLTSKEKEWQVELSPSISVHFGQDVRTIEKWNLTTVRFGAAIKFGSMTIPRQRAEQDVTFSVRSPQIVPQARSVAETFPIRNFVFFDDGSTKIPRRYILLSSDAANNFKEEHLFEPKPQQAAGRSARQIEVYYNVLNVLGDRMRKYPNTDIALYGSSKKGSDVGLDMAKSIKNYLVDVFGIDAKRIGTSGQTKPEIPSHQPGGTRELNLVTAEDNRVDITSKYLELILPVKIMALQEDPIDADVLFTVAGSENILDSWSVEVTDNRGKVKNFGPFKADQERISGNTILGDAEEGDYKIVMIGRAQNGATITKEQRIRLARSEGPQDQAGLRFSILFEFDQSKTVATYDKFLTETVVPKIPAGSNVVIHGHTDLIGEESHNLTLSRSRAADAMNVIQRELNKAGKKNVKFDTYGFGEDVRRSPFENNLPEERFYNRTVIIDIIP